MTTFRDAAALFQRYRRERHSRFTMEQGHLVSEARDLLAQLDPLLERIEGLNKQLTKKARADMPVDDPISMLRAAAESDPELAAWFERNPNPQVRDEVTGVNTPRGETREGVDEETQAQETELYQQTGIFYRTTHRLLKILRQLPDLEGIQCLEISIVRNQLLEHPEGQGSPITLHSFGYGTFGPRLKPIQSTEQAGVHQDQGLFRNADALSKALKQALSETLGT